MPRLSDDEIRQRLATLGDWTFADQAIQKEFTFDTFPAAILFVNAVAHLAESLDHHPDIEIHYRRVTLKYWTHTANGVTEKDFNAAQSIEQYLRVGN